MAASKRRADRWRPAGRVAGGGTIIGLSGEGDGSAWVASPAGLFQGKGGWWRPVVRGFPFAHVNAVLAAGDQVFAAGLSPAAFGLVRSGDGGHTWAQSWIDEVESPITCLAASPNFRRDGVLVAGTFNEGMLRSNDGGRNWRLSNFGLLDFAVLALAVTPDWGRREVIYAATEGGLYRSPNGGRAWRRVEIEGLTDPLQALAAGPDGAVFGGTENGRLYRSLDGGASWQSLSISEASPPSITSLLVVSNQQGSTVLAGAGEQGIYRSDDNGERWQKVYACAEPVLSLSAAGDILYAGLSQTGLSSSSDAGRGWQPVADLTARRFSRLLAPAPRWLVAAGPGEGVWISTDSGAAWQEAAEIEGEALLDLAAGNSRLGVVLLAATSAGLFRSADAGATWQCALARSAADGATLHSIACSPAFATDSRAWAGSAAGELWATQDGGCAWEPLGEPFGGGALLALAASPHFGSDRTLLAATADEAAREARLWRSSDAGASWEIWHTAAGEWPVPGARLAPAGVKGSKSGLALATEFHSPGPGGLRQVTLTPPEAPINAVAAVPGGSLRLAATMDGVWLGRSGANSRWRPEAGLDETAAPADLALSPHFATDRTIFLLTVDGRLWRRRLFSGAEA